MPFLLGWLARWPLWLLHAAGAVLGWLGWLLSPSYRRRLQRNAALAGVSSSERRRSVAQAGCLVTELPRLWLRPHEQPMADPVHWLDASLMDNWMADPRGVLLLTPHMGCFEVAAQAIVERYRRRLTVLYRPARKAWLRQLEETARARPNLVTAPATLAGVRQLLRALRQGEAVGMLPDQVPPEGMGVWAPFFGQPAYTMTLAARLVRQTGSAVGMLWAERLPRGQGYCMHVMPLSLPDVEGGAADEVVDATAINRAMETLVRMAPSQYLWGYHRYKSPRSVESAA